MNRNPFEHNYFIGYINQVTPQYVKVHFPSSVLLKSFVFRGEQYNGGLVGNYVVIEGEQHGFLGKMLEISLPENERLELSEKSFQNKEFHPTGIHYHRLGRRCSFVLPTLLKGISKVSG